MLVMALSSAVVWIWAMRRPASATANAAPPEDATPESPRPLSYVALGNSDVKGLFGNKATPGDSGWAALLKSYLPTDILFSTLGEGDRTMRETNVQTVPAVVRMNPDVVTLWNVVGDSTGGTPLTSYLTELRKALDHLTRETEAQVILLNLPDITLLMQGQSEEREAMVRGGIEQWNRVISEAASRYGRRVVTIDLYPISAQVLDPDTGNAALADAVWEELKARR